MYDRTLWEATPSDTFIFKLDARTKIVLLAVSAFSAIGLDSPRSLFLLFCLTLILHAMARSSLPRWRILLIFLLFGMWGSMVSQALFYNQEPRTVLACMVSPAAPVVGTWTGGIFLYREGLEYGAVQALRSGIMLATGLLICWNSDPRQLLRCFMHWKMPYEFAFMLTIGLRFLPLMFHEMAVVLTAQRLRGFEPLKTLAPQRLVRTAFQTLFPILARTLRRAVTLAFSVESRSFGHGGRRIDMTPWPLLQKSLCLLAMLGLACMAALKTMYALQYNGIAYFPALRNVYDFIVMWM